MTQNDPSLEKGQLLWDAWQREYYNSEVTILSSQGLSCQAEVVTFNVRIACIMNTRTKSLTSLDKGGKDF